MGLIPKKKLEVRRRAKAVFVDGIAEEQPETVFTVTGSVQPANSRDLATLPEGTRYKKLLRVYSKDYFAEADASETDEFFIDNEWLKVVKYNDWGNGIINHRFVLVGN